MQGKVFLLSLFSGSVVLGAGAQEGKPVLLKAPAAHIIKTDTIVKSAGSEGKKLLALNTTTAANAPFRGVPLAGHKAYYGKMTDYVNGFVRQYFGAHTKTLSVVQGRGNNKFSMIDNVLAKHNIPKELKYLAVIESALNNKALSPVGAVGPWQLMETTAQMLGLKVSAKRDDRTDWFKATNAAAQYLNTLYGQFNDWLLVVAAYNSGPVPVQRAIQRAGSRNFWDIKKYLPRETQGHVLAFIATASIFENMKKFIGTGSIPADFKFSNEDVEASTVAVPPKPRFTDEELKTMAIVRINEPLSLDLLGDELNIDKKLLRTWNSDYDLFLYNVGSEDFYALRIPKDKLDGFIEKKQLLSRRSAQLFAQETNIL
jgi:membrane-bound lytic murein transglycosylase D